MTSEWRKDVNNSHYKSSLKKLFWFINLIDSLRKLSLFLWIFSSYECKLTMKICWLFPYSSISIATLSQVCVFKKKMIIQMCCINIIGQTRKRVLFFKKKLGSFWVNFKSKCFMYCNNQFYIPILKNKINYKYLAYILDKTSDVLWK